MDRPTRSEPDIQSRTRPRQAGNETAYQHRSTPPPARQIVDVFRPVPVAKALKPQTTGVTAPPNNKPAPQTRSPGKSAKHRPRLLSRPILLYVLAGCLIITGGYLAYTGSIANKQASEQIQKLSDKVQAADGSDDNSPPSTTPLSADAVKNYVVAPNLPKYIDIPTLSVHARVLSMGVDSKSALQAPRNVFDAGWYNASAQPGQPGSTLIDGHISSWSAKGVFYGLNKLKTGDTITITRGDNQQFSYKVVSSETLPVAQVDMASLLVSPNTAKPGLSLISCSGDVIPGTNEFDKRIMIRAVLAD